MRCDKVGIVVRYLFKCFGVSRVWGYRILEDCSGVV